MLRLAGHRDRLETIREFQSSLARTTEEEEDYRMSFRRHLKGAGTSETSSRWAWPPGGGGGGSGRVSAAGGPRGGSLSALDLLDRSADEPDAGWPQTEAELAKLYQSSIMEQQQRHLEPLREDLADWLNKILGEFFFLTLPFYSATASCLAGKKKTLSCSTYPAS